MTRANARAEILKERGITDPSFTQNVLATQYEDCWMEYQKERDGKKKREIGVSLNRIIKMLGNPQKKKPIQDYKQKHAK